MSVFAAVRNMLQQDLIWKPCLDGRPTAVKLEMQHRFRAKERRLKARVETLASQGLHRHLQISGTKWSLFYPSHTNLYMQVRRNAQSGDLGDSTVVMRVSIATLISRRHIQLRRQCPNAASAATWGPPASAYCRFAPSHGAFVVMAGFFRGRTDECIVCAESSTIPTQKWPRDIPDAGTSS